MTVRVLGAALLALLAALLTVSVFPWIPALSRASAIGWGVVALAILRPAESTAYGFAFLAGFLADALVGAPIGVRAVVLVATCIAAQPLLRMLRIHRGVFAVIALSAVVAIAEHVLTPALRGDALAAPRWSLLAVAWWWGALWNIAVGVFVLRVARRWSPKPHAIV